MCGPEPLGGRLARWSQLHEGVDPHGMPLLVPWLRMVQALAAPLARVAVPPAAVLTPGAAAGTAAAAAAVLVSGLLDGLDGAVALLSDRVSPHGHVLDSACDRVCELAGYAALGLGAAFHGGRWACSLPAGSPSRRRGWCGTGTSPSRSGSARAERFSRRSASRRPLAASR